LPLMPLFDHTTGKKCEDNGSRSRKASQNR
jgi:hypothetical protein